MDDRRPARPGATTRRADAARNREALLHSARELLAEAGPDMAMDELARRAGVGRATLYRNFPTRDHVVAAVIEDQVEALRIAAVQASAAGHKTPGDLLPALEDWLRLYKRAGSRFGVVSAHVGPVVGSADTPVGRVCEPLHEAFAALWTEAVERGLVRADVRSEQVLALVGGLPISSPEPGSGGSTGAEPYLTIALDGLRPKSST